MTTFETVAQIIAENSTFLLSDITPETRLDDLDLIPWNFSNFCKG